MSNNDVQLTEEQKRDIRQYQQGVQVAQQLLQTYINGLSAGKGIKGEFQIDSKTLDIIPIKEDKCQDTVKPGNTAQAITKET